MSKNCTLGLNYNFIQAGELQKKWKMVKFKQRKPTIFEADIFALIIIDS